MTTGLLIATVITHAIFLIIITGTVVMALEMMLKSMLVTVPLKLSPSRSRPRDSPTPASTATTHQGTTSPHTAGSTPPPPPTTTTKTTAKETQKPPISTPSPTITSPSSPLSRPTVATETQTETDVITATVIATTAVTAITTATAPITASSDNATMAPTTSTYPTTISLNYGTYASLGISYGYAYDGHTDWSFKTTDRKDIQHASTSSTDALIGFICNRLATPCQAPQSTADVCWAAEKQVVLTGQLGQDTADLWNELIA
ncbi:hypothetical protein BO78DRAFT_470552 [Aspergillus sclerotiicarbonarius CBS 121057]|uniref:Uncharacterized protein n=1 Tax=Aspergillus sclerotiicarbonarius (strain CBS 121057 / IBT 28362) TaxID=1448318 RepID=A0A319EGC1_ASPSB|nr:hypothetical protein BO78DRAFT_470552 [Aspergillus sclerotiicarbonarius CBS 121057]